MFKPLTIIDSLRLSRYRPLLVLALAYLAISFCLRIVLWWRFGLAAEVPVWQLLLLLPVGFINDVVQLLYLLLPFSLYLLLVPQRLYQHRLHRAILAVGSFITLFGMFYLAVAEFVFFDEFNARFNLVAVDYLIYPHEVFINIWQSYPVTTVLLVSIGLSLAALYFLWPWMMGKIGHLTPLRHRAAVFGGHAALLTLAIVGFNTDSLAFWENRVSNELAANGVSSFFRAFHTNELNYEAHYRTDRPAQMFHRLVGDLKSGGGRFTHLTHGRLDRHFNGRRNGLGKLNVVVIVEESFGAEFVGAYGSKKELTPEFDALAKKGWLFTRTYATGTRTVRGLEAITASFPPIPSESIIKRPGSEHIANWGQVMNRHGYKSSFLYGGYSYFDNMGHFYSSNGFAVKDRTDIKRQTFANIWGVCDEDLLRYAIGYFGRLHRRGEPFFSIVMTTSNHRPYTFPAGIDEVATEGGGRVAGVRYADYALGVFFREARKQPWFRNTVFVIVADHGARVYGRAQIPLRSYEIPLLVLAPGHLKPRKIDTLTSQMDIAPTILGLLGLSYEAPFFGQNVLAMSKRPRTLLFNHNHKVALLRGSEMVVLGLRRSARSYRYEHKTNRYIAIPPNRRLIDLATAYYQIAFEQFRRHRYQ